MISQRKGRQTEMLKKIKDFFFERKVKRTLHNALDNKRVVVYMADGTIKNVSGKEWLAMDSRLIKHFVFVD